MKQVWIKSAYGTLFDLSKVVKIAPATCGYDTQKGYILLVTDNKTEHTICMSQNGRGLITKEDLDTTIKNLVSIVRSVDEHQIIQWSEDKKIFQTR